MIIARTCSKCGPTMVVPQGTAKWTSHPPALRAVDMKRKFGTWGRAKEAFVHWLNRWIAEGLSLRA
jgi:hypothetical protein